MAVAASAAGRAASPGGVLPARRRPPRGGPFNRRGADRGHAAPLHAARPPPHAASGDPRPGAVKAEYDSQTGLYTYSIPKVLSQIAAREAEQKEATARAPEPTMKAFNWEVVAYHYYNWRKDTGQDILLLLGVTVLVVALLGLGNVFIPPPVGEGNLSSEALLASTYNIAELWYQDGFPQEGAGTWVRQLYSVGVSSVGMVFFTILLAMVEQSFLEVLDRNVRRGSDVYGEGHILVLAWVGSALSMNTVWKVLAELCEAYQPEGGTRVVVLSNKPKLEMERQFSEFIPNDQRLGTSFVFRQGSPLIPRNLNTVAATRASSTIIVSDHTRAALEADAQALRAAVLLDEMYGRSTARGNIIVEMQTRDAAQLVRSSCSPFVIPVTTYSLNSLRLAKLVQRPISVVAASKMMHFPSSQLHFHSFPELAGVPYSDLKYYFPTATVLALVDRRDGAIMWNPRGAVLEEEHDVILLRPTDRPSKDFRPQPALAVVDLSSSFEEPNEAACVDRLFILDSHSKRVARSLPVVPKASAILQGPSKRLLSGSVNEPRSEAGDEEEGKGEEEQDKGLSGTGGEDKGLEQLLAPSASLSDAATLESFGMDGGAATPEALSAVGRPSVEGRLAPLKVLIIGWAEDSLMVDTIRELDRGLAALPRGSQVTLFNDHFRGFNGGRDRRDAEGHHGVDNPQHAVLKEVMARLKRISLLYREGCPLDTAELCSLPINSFDCIIILCDQVWLDPDLDPANGIDARQPEDMQRIDSMTMMVAVAVRSQINADKDGPTALVVTEKTAFDGITRFDDFRGLPFVFGYNRKHYAARLLAQVAYEPRVLPVSASFVQSTVTELREPSEYSLPGEKLTYWALMERVEKSGGSLIGYAEVVADSSAAADKGDINVVLNPSVDFRSQKCDFACRRLKLITLSSREGDDADAWQPGAQPKGAFGLIKDSAARSGSEIEMAMKAATKKRSSSARG